MHTKEDYLDAIEMAYPGQLANEWRDQVWNSIEPLIADDVSEADWEEVRNDAGDVVWYRCGTCGGDGGVAP